MTEYRPDIVVFHGDCMDGWTAAWVCARKWPGVPLHPGKYGEPPPAVAGKHVLLVDFSYKRDVLVQLVDVHHAKSVLVLDHHKSAAEDLRLFTVPDDEFQNVIDHYADDAWMARHAADTEDGVVKMAPIAAVFDMERSGAGLAWDFCYPGLKRPRLVDYVEDRDLWRFALPGSREINAYVASWTFGLDDWTEMAGDLDQEKGRAMAALAGAAIHRKQLRDLNEMLPNITRTRYIGGKAIPVANLSYIFASDAGNILAREQAPTTFAATYYDDADGYRLFSLRSVDGGMDVSKIADQYGGGGHEHAAGFRVKRGMPQRGLSQDLWA